MTRKEIWRDTSRDTLKPNTEVCTRWGRDMEHKKDGRKTRSKKGTRQSNNRQSCGKACNIREGIWKRGFSENTQGNKVIWRLGGKTSAYICEVIKGTGMAQLNTNCGNATLYSKRLGTQSASPAQPEV